MKQMGMEVCNSKLNRILVSFLCNMVILHICYYNAGYVTKAVAL